MDLEELIVRQRLHELTARFSRAADRLDAAAMEALFHPDALVDSGVVCGRPDYFASEFVRWVRQNAHVIFHLVSSELFQVDGSRARGESYVLALSRLRAEFVNQSADVDVVTAGRYLDRFERRQGEWKFTERRFVLDYSMSRAAEGQPPDRSVAAEGRGGFAPHDPSYGFWA